MSAAPQLTLLTGPGGCSLAGWEDRKRWAMMNDALWRVVFMKAAPLGIQESDTLKLLAVAQAEQIAELKALLERTF